MTGDGPFSSTNDYLGFVVSGEPRHHGKTPVRRGENSLVVASERAAGPVCTSEAVPRAMPTVRMNAREFRLL
ncbi:hypothetical protein [Nocardia carnea]|uniref:hypothetical protein n=1 Tax=Nocardia carnea TaxID=37328 RepID=UPI0024538430|nr:hypothetical protein [Nocardia carnea]